MNIREFRKPEYDVDTVFVNRWSPRAMSGEGISEQELMALFEAARWAPSANNNQPWRFVYARKGTPHWQPFLNLLVELNRVWAVRAAALVVVISKKTFDHNGKFSRTHSYDTGAAWENLALQGSLKGLVVHGMQGFDYDRARELLNVPDGYQVEAMAAIGKPGMRETLPETYREREYPSDRKKMSEIVMEGSFQERGDAHA
jgi:nitroreductase